MRGMYIVLLKVFVTISMILITITLSACGGRVTALEDIEIRDYDVLYAGNDFIIYILEDIPSSQYTIGISVDNLKDEVCFLSITTTNAYIVYYDNQYISLQDGVVLDLFDTYDLMDHGVAFQCRDKE